MMKEQKFDLLENGLDFVESGIQYVLQNENLRSLKYTILHLSSGIELILKDQVRKEHWTLIFDDINKASVEALQSGDFKSIDFQTTLNRLEKTCGILIAEKDKSILKNLRSLRNKIEHFEFQLHSNAVKSLASKVLLFLLNYIQENIDRTSITPEIENYLDILRLEHKKLESFTLTRLSQVKSKIDDAMKNKSSIEICPACREEALILDSDKTCAFCLYTDQSTAMANLYIENILGENAHDCVMNGSEFPLYDCVNCLSSDTLVAKKNCFVCFECGESNSKNDLSFCGNCGELYQKTEGDINLCDDCVRNLITERD